MAGARFIDVDQKFVADDIPDSFTVYTKLVMDENIAEAGNFMPLNFVMLNFKVI